MQAALCRYGLPAPIAARIPAALARFATIKSKIRQESGKHELKPVYFQHGPHVASSMSPAQAAYMEFG